MNFYNTTNTENSLVHTLWDLCDADIISIPLAVATRWMNLSLEEIVGLIINADGTWQFDDTNYTDTPRGKGTLVSGQELYTFDAKYLQIEAIDILDLNNYYIRIDPLDHKELGGISPDEFFGLEAGGTPKLGAPTHYDKITDDSFRLYPAPSATYCTLTNGLRVWFKRTAHLFAVTDMDAIPGFVSPYHVLLAYMSAIPYCMKYHKDRVALYEKKVMELKAELINHYAQREKDTVKKITFKQRSFR